MNEITITITWEHPEGYEVVTETDTGRAGEVLHHILSQGGEVTRLERDAR